ncbi:hypothetical protein OUZ56_004946, partial [Daphnia magna]
IYHSDVIEISIHPVCVSPTVCVSRFSGSCLFFSQKEMTTQPTEGHQYRNGRFPTIPHIHKHYVKQRRDLYEAKVIDTLRCSSRRGIINKTNIQKRFCPPPHTSPPPPFWAVSFFCVCVLFSIFTESHGLLSWLLSCYYIHGDPQQTDPSYLS